MARIYNRDSINYSGLIGQAIQNANQTSQLYANKWQPGSTMGQALGQAGEKLQQAGWNEWSAQQNDARAQAMQQRQFEQQDKMQRAQEEFQREQAAQNFGRQLILNDINAKNALELAKIQKEAQAEYNRDEWHMQYQNATADYDAAKAELIKDPNNIDKQRAFQRAEANVIRWGDKLNYDVYDAPRVHNLADELPSDYEVENSTLTNDEIKSSLDEIFKSKKLTDEERAQAENLIPQLPEGERRPYELKLNRSGKTSDEIKRENESKLKNWKKPGDPLPPGWEPGYVNGVLKPVKTK